MKWIRRALEPLNNMALAGALFWFRSEETNHIKPANNISELIMSPCLTQEKSFLGTWRFIMLLAVSLCAQKDYYYASDEKYSR